MVVAVLAKDTNLAATRAPSTLELTYLDIAADLSLMVAAGTFPPRMLEDAEMSPRVGDGLRLLSISRIRHNRYRALQRANGQRGATGTIEPSRRIYWLPSRGTDGQDQLEAVMPPHC